VLAAKLFYFNTKTDGYYRDANTGRPTGGSQDQNFGAAFLLTPGGGFNALLTLERQIQYYVPVGGTLVSSSDLFGQVVAGAGFANEVNHKNTTDLYTVFRNPKGPRPSGHYNAPAATLQMNWDTGPVKLTSVTGYRKSFEDQVQPFDGTSLGLYISHRIQPFHQFSEELRAAGAATATLDYVAGLYYYDGVYTLTQTTDLFGGGFGLPQVVSGEAKSAAAFADFDWAFIDEWRFNFGGRYTQDKKSLNNTAVDATTGKETFLGAPSATFSKFTPKASIDFRPSADFMYYASYSVGYRSGGFSNRALTAVSTNTPFHPETVDSAEVGIKSEWFGRRMSVNAAYFDAQYKNMQQNTTIPGGATGNQTIVTNVGSSVIRGLELELIGRATQNLTLNASIGTLSSHFDGFIVNQVIPGETVRSPTNYSKNNLIYAPPFTASASADYRLPTSFGDIRGNLGYRHISSYDLQISLGPYSQPGGPGTLATVFGNDPRVRDPGQNIVDASIRSDFNINKAKAYLTVYGRNLTDSRVGTDLFTVAGLFAFGFGQEPRNFGVTLGFEY
jgi:iron complex outermembrane recepter protein